MGIVKIQFGLITGLSRDVKPILPLAKDVGVKFYEKDTGTTYIWTSDREWVKHYNQSELGDLSTGLEKVDNGWAFIGRNPAGSAPIGWQSVDFSSHSYYAGNGNIYGPQSDSSYCLGGGHRMPAAGGNYGAHLAVGSENYINGYYNGMAFGTKNNITGSYNMFITGYGNTANAHTQVGQGFGAGVSNSLSGYWPFAIGAGLIAKWQGGVVVGSGNIDGGEGVVSSSRPALLVGIGNASNLASNYGSVSVRKDGFKVRYDGRVSAPSMTIAQIDADATGKMLTTKEWINAQGYGGVASGLEAIDEGNGIGFRIIGRDPALYGNIGKNAVDFGTHFGDATQGATGEMSFSLGNDNKVSGVNGVAIGYNNTVSVYGGKAFGDAHVVTGNSYAAAFGYGNTVNGYTGFAAGELSQANGDYSTAFGSYAVASGWGAFAQGYGNNSTGSLSTTFGGENNNAGYSSAAFGYLNTLSTGNCGYSITAGARNSVISSYGAALGLGLIIKSAATTVVGQGNLDYTNTSASINVGTAPHFIVGNGVMAAATPNTITSRSNAFEVLHNGSVIAPSLTTALIDSVGAKSLITKEYADANYSGVGVSDNVYTTDGTIPTGVNRVISVDPNGSFEVATDNFESDFWMFNDTMQIGAKNLTLYSIDNKSQLTFIDGSPLEMLARNGFKLRLGSAGTPTPPTVGQVLAASSTTGDLEWATISGGGGLSAADNGLTDNAGTVELGGVLTKSTKISSTDGATSLTLAMADNVGESLVRKLVLGTTSASLFSGDEPSNTWGDIRALANGVRIEAHSLPNHSRIFMDTTEMRIEDTINNIGFVYDDDYSANYTDRSLVDRGYVRAEAVTNETDTYGGATVKNIISLSQTDYDNIGTKDDSTMYIIL